MNNKDLLRNMNIDESVLQRIRELQRIPIDPQLLEQARAISSQMESFRNSFNSNSQLAQFSRSLQVVQSLPLENILKEIREMYRPLLEIKSLIPQINLTVRTIFESLEPLRIKLSENNQLFEQFRQAINFSYAETLAQVAKDHSTLLSRNRNFVLQIRENIILYNRFAQQTITQLAKISDVKINLSLKGSLLLANEQTLRSTDLIEPLFEKISRGNRNNLLERIPSNRFQIQKRELLQRDDIEEDEEYESLIIKSPAAISFELISNCMTLIGLCNEASETTKGNTIFTLTSTLWLSAWKLMGVVPTNKDSFAIIIDCLYLMLYEGAGKDKLRFIEQGYIDAPEAELIWKIKHLRNKWLRHDIDHGKETDIRKSHQHRKEALEWFGLGKVPYSKDEFIFLYNNLMLKVEEFLKLLLDRVSKFSN